MPVSLDQKAKALDTLIAQYPDATEMLLNSVGLDSRDFKIYPKRGDVFPLQRLPSELRLEILEYILLANSPIKILSCVDKEATEERRQEAMQVNKINNIIPGAKRNTIYNIRSRIKVDGTRRAQKQNGYAHDSRLSILYVSKSIYAEARPVVYGHNKFTFDNPESFSRFMHMIGSGTSEVTEVTICDFGRHGQLPDLERALRLRRLEIVPNSSWSSSRTVWKGSQVASAARRLIMTVLEPLNRRKGCSCPEDHLCVCVSRNERQHLWDILVLKLENLRTDNTDWPTTDREGLATLEAEVMKAWEVMLGQ